MAPALSGKGWLAPIALDQPVYRGQEFHPHRRLESVDQRSGTIKHFQQFALLVLFQIEFEERRLIVNSNRMSAMRMT